MVILMHVVVIPRLMLIRLSHLNRRIVYAIFSLFDPGVDYSTLNMATLSVTYIVMTQMLVGMGKATFTVVTANPFIHFVGMCSVRGCPSIRQCIQEQKPCVIVIFSFARGNRIVPRYFYHSQKLKNQMTKSYHRSS